MDAEKKKGTGYFFDAGRPRGRRADSRQPAWAVRCCHSGAPNGAWRVTPLPQRCQIRVAHRLRGNVVAMGWGRDGCGIKQMRVVYAEPRPVVGPRDKPGVDETVDRPF